MTRCFVPLVAAALLLAACGSDSASDSNDDLTDREFISTTVDGYDQVPGTQIRIAFSDGSLDASAGCNSMGGEFSLNDNTLILSGLATTEMGCESPLMEQDIWLGTFLTSTPTVSLDGDTLVLTGDDATTINMLDREVADPDRAIEGTLWIVDSIITDDAISNQPLLETATMTFSDGSVMIETGCNGAGGPVEITDDTITFGDIAMTLIACPSAETELENTVLAVLNGEVTYEIEASRLTVLKTTVDGTIGLSFTTAD